MKAKLLRISAEYHTPSNTWYNVRIAGKFVSNTDESMIVNMLHQLTSASRYNRFVLDGNMHSFDFIFGQVVLTRNVALWDFETENEHTFYLDFEKKG